MVEIASHIPLSQRHPKTNHKHNLRGRAKFGSLYGESRAEYIVKRWKYQRLIISHIMSQHPAVEWRVSMRLFGGGELAASTAGSRAQQLLSDSA